MTLSKACPVVRTTSTQEYSQYLRPLATEDRGSTGQGSKKETGRRGCDITASQYGYETTSSQRMPRPCAGLKNKQVRQCSIPRDMPITRVPIYASIFFYLSVIVLLHFYLFVLIRLLQQSVQLSARALSARAQLYPFQFPRSNSSRPQ